MVEVTTLNEQKNEETGKAKVNATEEVEQMKEATGQPTGVHIHMKAPNGKITKTTFLGTHSAVAGAKKHITGLEKKGHTVHKKELAFALLQGSLKICVVVRLTSLI